MPPDRRLRSSTRSAPQVICRPGAALSGTPFAFALAAPLALRRRALLRAASIYAIIHAIYTIGEEKRPKGEDAPI